MSGRYVVRRAVREFSKDECTDLAAGLTYYGILALFPAALAMLSLVGLVGQGPSTVTSVLEVLRDLGAAGVADTMEPTLRSLSQASGAASIALVGGLALALWSASGYVSAFGRAMNRMYGVGEGRPFWKLRPLQVVVTLAAVVLAAVVALSLVLTGPAAGAVGEALGIGDDAVLVWNIAKWPVILVAVMMIVALLYYATPNVKQPKFRWISPGAAVAILVWVAASAAFGFYVANFGSYNKTYGTLAGAVVFLLWLWLTNVALLFGAELDSELERNRELEAGIAAESGLQLPLRDTRNTKKAAEKEREYVRWARELRLAAAEDADETGHADEKESSHAR